MDAAVTPYEALKGSVDILGSQSAYARLCGVSQTAVWKWLQSGKRLPAEHVLTVEAQTGVSRHLLRPDIYPPVAPHAPRLPKTSLEDASNRRDCNQRRVSQRSAG